MRRALAVLCVAYVALPPWWGPAAEAGFRLERADGHRPGAGITIAGMVTAPRTPLGASVASFLPKPPPASLKGASGRVNWDALARCESSGNWGESSGYYEGGVQLSPENWDSHKPPGAPEAAYMASREQQIHAAEGVLAEEGRRAWPPLLRAACN